MEDDEVTSTPFSATVREGEPYDFDAFSAQDVQASVRLTHIAYHPPTSRAALETYYREHPNSSCPVVTTCTGEMTYAVLEVEDISLGNEPCRVVVGCFPLDLSRLPQDEGDDPSGKTMSFQYGHKAILPAQTDVLRSINIQLDVDGSVKFFMRGPGEVFLYGEQFAALIPEWRNHHFFRVGADDEENPEYSDMSDGEMNEMFRYVHD